MLPHTPPHPTPPQPPFTRLALLELGEDADAQVPTPSRTFTHLALLEPGEDSGIRARSTTHTTPPWP